MHRGKPLDIIIKDPKDLVMSQTTIAKALCKYYSLSLVVVTDCAKTVAVRMIIALGQWLLSV